MLTVPEANVILRPEYEKSDLTKGSHSSSVRTEPYNPNNDIIVAATLCKRISYIAAVENTAPKPSPLTIHLWVRLNQMLGSSVKNLSKDITDIDNVIKNKVLQRICDMTAIEV